MVVSESSVGECCVERPCLSQRIYYSLAEVENDWGMSAAELWQWLVHGALVASVWLPLRSVYENREKSVQGHTVISRHLRHMEGYIDLSADQCRKLSKQGCLYLWEFTQAETGARYTLPETADTIEIEHADLVILHHERERVENLLCKRAAQSSVWKMPFDPTLKHVRFQGEEYLFGDVQAEILRHLYEAARCGNPWMNGKQLLAVAGSQSFTLSNVFKHHPAWEQRLIVSDGRGSYQLDPELVACLTRDAENASS